MVSGRDLPHTEEAEDGAHESQQLLEGGARAASQPEQPRGAAPNGNPLRRLATAVWNSGLTCISLAALVFAVVSWVVVYALGMFNSPTARRAHPRLADLLHTRPLHAATRSSLQAAALVKVIKALTPGITVFEIIVVRSALAMACSAAAARGGSVTLCGQRQHWPLLACRGLLGAAAMTLFYASLVRIPLADTMVLMFANPSICAVLGWALLGERFGWRTGVG